MIMSADLTLHHLFLHTGRLSICLPMHALIMLQQLAFMTFTVVLRTLAIAALILDNHVDIKGHHIMLYASILVKDKYCCVVLGVMAVGQKSKLV